MRNTTSKGLRTVFPRVWLVFCDHSVVGVWRTRQEAAEAVQFRQLHAIDRIEHHVVGPYILRLRGAR